MICSKIAPVLRKIKNKSIPINAISRNYNGRHSKRLVGTVLNVAPG